MKIKYKTATAFRIALEQRLMKLNKTNGTDLAVIRKSIAFDQLLSRLFRHSPDIWVLKGGYSMQLRIEKSRATKDIDLSMKETALKSKKGEEVSSALLKMLEEAAEIDLGDYFNFVIGRPTLDLTNAPYGGSRFPIQSLMDGRSFEKFSLDIGIGDAWLEPKEKLSTKGWLEFAGIPREEFPAISKEQQFAEKIHAYTLPRDKNSRVKDLVDMTLLVSSGEMNPTQVVNAIEATFKRRDTHAFSPNLAEPPSTWGTTFASMAVSTGLPTDIDKGFQTVIGFVKKLPLK